ncbi:MAG TPA: HAD family phosphatase [Patescibacteria group bacterium]|nr:HAD family phosphatase [Patescibacteria group bacterium]
MIKAIVFDCFGVLVGSSFWDVYRASGGDPVKDDSFIDNVLAQANAGFISSSDLRRQAAERIGTSYEVFTANMRRMEQPNVDLFAYIEKELKPHYKIAMLSNADKGAPQRHLTDKQLALLDVVVVSGEIGYAKPDPEAFQITIDRLGVTLSEIVFIDDLPCYVEPARAMGITTIQYVDLASFRQQLEAILQ